MLQNAFHDGIRLYACDSQGRSLEDFPDHLSKARRVESRFGTEKNWLIYIRQGFAVGQRNWDKWRLIQINCKNKAIYFVRVHWIDAQMHGYSNNMRTYNAKNSRDYCTQSNWKIKAKQSHVSHAFFYLEILEKCSQMKCACNIHWTALNGKISTEAQDI